MAMKHKPEDLQTAVDLMYRFGSTHKAQTESGIAAATIRDRVRAAKRKGIEPQKDKYTSEADMLRRQVKDLNRELKGKNADTLDEEMVKSRIFKLSNMPSDPPKWLVKPQKKGSSPGIPTLFFSDIHYGEVVDPAQVAGKNAFNKQIAEDRIRLLTSKTINLLKNHMRYTDYDGFVLVLGGDCFSGAIHEELTETNEEEIMQSLLNLHDMIVWMIGEFLKEFPRIFVPVVTGNHGRSSRKPRHKNRVYQNYDWLLGCLLERYFKNDKRVSFLVSDGPDLLYKVYNHRYLLSHGDQARGGDGIIGPLGPVIRMDHKKRTRQGQLGMEYDTLIVGHFHTLLQMPRVIINGTLKGFCEYAFANNFPVEEPQQALWITHPTEGITFQMAVHLGGKKKLSEKPPWVSVTKGEKNERNPVKPKPGCISR